MIYIGLNASSTVSPQFEHHIMHFKMLILHYMYCKCTVLYYIASAVSSISQSATGLFQKLKLHQADVVQKVISKLEVFSRLMNWFLGRLVQSLAST